MKVAAAAYRSWLRDGLKLTAGGRILVSLVFVLAVAGVIGGVVLSFYNVESGHDPDGVLGFQIAFTVVVISILTGAVTGLVVVLDAGFRWMRSRVHR